MNRDMSDEISAAHERMAEQVMSDERLLSVLPDDASERLLDWTLRGLDAAAANASDAEDFLTRADALRAQARRIADAAAGSDGDPGALEALLTAADTEAASAATINEPTLAGQSPEMPGDAVAGDGALGDGALGDGALGDGAVFMAEPEPADGEPDMAISAPAEAASAATTDEPVAWPADPYPPSAEPDAVDAESPGGLAASFRGAARRIRGWFR
jgi:hypothetical protein